MRTYYTTTTRLQDRLLFYHLGGPWILGTLGNGDDEAALWASLQAATGKTWDDHRKTLSAHTTGISCSLVYSYRGVVVVVVVVVVDVELGGALSGALGCPPVRSVLGLLLIPPDC